MTNKYYHYTSSRITRNTFSCITKHLLSLYVFLYNDIYLSLYKKTYNDNKCFIICLLI